LHAAAGKGNVNAGNAAEISRMALVFFNPRQEASAMLSTAGDSNDSLQTKSVQDRLTRIRAVVVDRQSAEDRSPPYATFNDWRQHFKERYVDPSK
jgi:hypothetical protein